MLFAAERCADGQRFRCKGGVQQPWLRIVSSAKPPDDDAIRSRRVFARRSCSAKYHDYELATASAFANETGGNKGVVRNG